MQAIAKFAAHKWSIEPQHRKARDKSLILERILKTKQNQLKPKRSTAVLSAGKRINMPSLRCVQRSVVSVKGVASATHLT